MSFEDLPPDWPRRPLTGTVFVHDLLDLCVGDADRAAGGLAVLALRRDLTLAQPVFVAGPVPERDRRGAVTDLLRACTGTDDGAAVVLAIVHPAPAFTDEDRALHQVLIDVCTDLALRLVSSHLVTPGGITALPRLTRVA